MTDDLLSDWEDVGHPHVELIEPVEALPIVPDWEVSLLDEDNNDTFRVPVQPILDGPKVLLSGAAFRGIPPAMYDRYRVYYRGAAWKTCSMDRFRVSSTSDEIHLGITLNLENQ